MSLYAWIVAAALAACAGFIGGARWVQGNWDAERVALRDAALEQQRLAQRNADARNERTQGALDDYARKVRAQASVAAGARGELERLRNGLAAADRAASGADPAGFADDAARARIVVGECAAALQEVAAAADACDAQLGGLQGWVRAAFPAAQETVQ